MRRGVLVTGGAGYVGGVCCAELVKQGFRVTVVDDLSTGHLGSLPDRVQFHKVDIGDRAAMRELLLSDEFDAVFHFAAKALIPESIANPGAFFDSNVASSISLLESMRTVGIRKFVFSSSAAVYGNPHSTPIDEGHPTNPVNAYGETKLMIERVLRWYAEAYGWSVVAFRYFNACGAAAGIGEDHRPETHIIPLLLQTACGEREYFEVFGNDYPTEDGTCLRDYVHVSDIAGAHLMALQALEQPGLRIYNIGTGQNFSVLQIAKVVQRLTGRPLRTKFGLRRAGDPAVLCASPARLMTELNWRPRHSDLHEIVSSAWQWKREHPHGYETASATLVR